MLGTARQKDTKYFNG